MYYGLWDLKKFRVFEVFELGRILSFSILCLYRDLEKFRTVPLYTGPETSKIPNSPPIYYRLWELEKFRVFELGRILSSSIWLYWDLEKSIKKSELFHLWTWNKFFFPRWGGEFLEVLCTLWIQLLQGEGGKASPTRWTTKLSRAKLRKMRQEF